VKVDRIVPRLESRAEAEFNSGLFRALSGDPRLPVVAYYTDDLPLSHRQAADVAHAAAMKHLATFQVTLTALDVPGVEPGAIWSVSGHEHAAEKILDPALRSELETRIGSPHIAVGAPHGGQLFATRAALAPDLVRLVHDTYTRNLAAYEKDGEARAALLSAGMSDDNYEATAARPVSPMVWLLEGGVVVGARAPDVPLIPVLRERQTAIEHGWLWRPLHEHPELPVIVYLPRLEGASPVSRAEVEDVEATHDKAIAHARASVVLHRLQPIDVPGAPLGSFVVVGGDPFNVARLSDPAFLRLLHAVLQSERLALSAPIAGLLLVCADHPKQLPILASLAQLAYEEAELRDILVTPSVWVQHGSRIERGVKFASVRTRKRLRRPLIRAIFKTGHGVGGSLVGEGIGWNKEEERRQRLRGWFKSALDVLFPRRIRPSTPERADVSRTHWRVITFDARGRFETVASYPDRGAALRRMLDLRAQNQFDWFGYIPPGLRELGFEAEDVGFRRTT